MKLLVQKGKTSFLACVFIQDSSSTVGAGLSGLVFNTSGLICYRARSDDGNAAGTQITLATATLGTWATGGFKEKDATNMKGVYEIGITNASLATGSDYCILYFSGATNMAPLVLEIQLVAFDPDAATNLGLTALPTANPGAAAGLFIAGTNAATTITSAGGDALTLSSTGTNGNGLNVSGNGSGHAFKMTGGATGNAMTLIGGGTSGDGLNVTTTSGHGFNIAATGSSKHGITSTGGNAGTSDGIKGAAGTGGVDIRGNLTGNITGTLSTCTTVTNQLTAAAIATGIWTDTTAGDFTTALSVGKSVMNGVSLGTGLTVNSLTNLPSIPANWITAAGIADAAIDRATFAVDTGLQNIRANTAQAGAGTNITLDASASATNSFYNNDLIYLTGGTGVGQARFITAYVGATKVATVGTWATNPDATTTFAILPFDAVAGATAPTVAQIATGVWQDTTAGDFTVASSIGKSLYTTGNVPGAASGLALVGSNMGTITGALTAAQIATGIWQDTTAGDFTVASSIGKSVMNGVALGTGLTINQLTTNNDKTGYSLTQSFPSNFSSLSIDGSGNVGITSNVKKNTASAGFTFVMRDSTTHAPATGLTVTATRSIDGAAFGACTNAVAELSNGWYKIDLSAADVNGNHIALKFTAAASDDTDLEIITQP